MSTQTAVTRRNAVKQLIRSMNGTMFSSTLTLFLSSAPSWAPMRPSSSCRGYWGRAEHSPLRLLHLGAVVHHQVDHLHGDLVDIVDDLGGLALQQRVAEEAD